MSVLVLLHAAWPDRLAPEPAGPAGLGLALATIAALVAYQLSGPWERTGSAPGPRRAGGQGPAHEARALHWAVAAVLVAALAVIVVERMVVLT